MPNIVLIEKKVAQIQTLLQDKSRRDDFIFLDMLIDELQCLPWAEKSHTFQQGLYNALTVIIKLSKILIRTDKINSTYENILNLLNNSIDQTLEHQFDAVLNTFDNAFSQSDWHRAEIFFMNFPQCVFAGSKDNLMYSYLRFYNHRVNKNFIFRLGLEIGSGSYGRVRTAALKNGSKSEFVVKRLDLSQNRLSYTEALQEAYNNRRIGSAVTDLITRPGTSKCYQILFHMGTNLNTFLKSNALSFEQKMKLSIKLLLKMIDSHEGYNGFPWTHGDLNSTNVAINLWGDIQFIDLATMRVEGLDKPHFNHTCTLPYAPISFNPNNRDFEISKMQSNSIAIIRTPNYFFDDKISVLRLIFHQLGYRSILNLNDFEALPDTIQNILSTYSVDYCLYTNHLYPPRFIASVLIQYLIKKNEFHTGMFHQLQRYPSLQENVISKFRAQIQSEREALIKLRLIRREVTLNKIPIEYRNAASMPPHFLIFLLENQFIRDEMLFVVAKYLKCFSDKIENRDDFLSIIYSIKLMNKFFEISNTIEIHRFYLSLESKSFEIKDKEWHHLFAKSLRYGKPASFFLDHLSTRISTDHESSRYQNSGRCLFFSKDTDPATINSYPQEVIKKVS